MDYLRFSPEIKKMRHETLDCWTRPYVSVDIDIDCKENNLLDRLTKWLCWCFQMCTFDMVLMFSW
jgi:hypothetical protein